MKLVGARLGDHVDHGAGIASVFGVEGIGENAKFFDGIGRRLHRGQIHELSLASPPFTLKLLDRPRPPFTETLPAFSLPK